MCARVHIYVCNCTVLCALYILSGYVLMVLCSAALKANEYDPQCQVDREKMQGKAVL